MDFGANNGLKRSSSRVSRVNRFREDLNQLCEHNINFYTAPPVGKISLEEAEEWVSERLNLLGACDEMLKTSETVTKFKRDHNYFEQLETRLSNAESKSGKNFYKTSSDTLSRRKDLVSHFLLRIYYCRNEELKRWFISRECELLRARLAAEKNTGDLATILSDNGFLFEQALPEEITELYNDIHWASFKVVSNQVVYKMPFEQSIEAVKNRRAFLKDGFAYIPIQDMVSVICSKFRAHLSYSLAVIQKALHELEEDQRLIPRLHSLHLHHIQSRKSALKQSEDDADVVTPDMVDTLSKESFAPCMRNIHEVLRKDHHLKYYGRLHYGLFLKGIGLTLEDALSFFREEFIHIIPPDKFQKEYAYNIRYNYGKEGRKVSGKAFGCQKILNDNPPGPGDTHGCPFKHFDKKHLKLMLAKHEINENHIQEIMQMVEQQEYGSACSKYFNAKHHWYPTPHILHPNQFYTESRKALKNPTLTPPSSGQLLSDETSHDITLFGDTTTDTMAVEESMFENEDEFDRSMATMDLDVSATERSEIDSADTQ